VAQIKRLVESSRKVFALPPDVEITLEANPGSVDAEYLVNLRRSGVNRLSIGMQSAHEDELRLFARGHTVQDVQTTVDLARRAGFDNLNLDLIYGVPNQTMAMWQTSLETALNMEPAHLSLYGLGLEDGTPMQRWVQRGDLPLPDPDLAADMYEWTEERLAGAGFEQYEVSNWSKPGYACRHNLHYWQNGPYLGLGAGAHGYAGGMRYVTVLHPAHYIERIQAQQAPLPFPLSGAVESTEPVDETAMMADQMIMGLRLTQEGISASEFHTRFGRSLWDTYGSELSRLLDYRLLEQFGDDHLRLTPRGRLLGNRVFSEFV
jgi:oxygen-independent coproporphyrinogen-3 oxidase